MKKRIFLMPGFGEDSFCFDEIVPFLNEFDLKVVDYRPTLDKFIFPFISLRTFTKQLVADNNILKEDKIIGHSMGGYFAFSVRELTGAQICMIAAFSDPQKLYHFFPTFPRSTQLNIISGFLKTNYLKSFLLNKIKDEKIKKVQEAVMENFKTFSNLQLAKMMEMNYEKKIISSYPNPLRIHDVNDKVIGAPDEPFTSIAGGHFCLNLYPKETIEAMADFLKT
ncbi:MAG: alpha/beta hydrolase [Bacteroidetes bacterium]|nr:alpha/beta hydrolase [Bacteroidota bacterium]